jgi:hypothetical protein
VQDCLAISLSKCLVELLAVILGENISCEWLSSVLVDSLKHLIFELVFHAIAIATAIVIDAIRTLYAAAYPRPGKREKNRAGTEAPALSLKTMVFNCAIDATFRNRQQGPYQLIPTIWLTLP